ncbi:MULTISPECIES: hypothetical protein [Pandoraea]|uniref:hypothetical protein n=1 Tax=Pandoraea TaxID=93217 RepID=UPI001F5E3332|nr:MULTISPECIES: hypothetical protein [Pandoraea]MCI3207194.1 hypothetical protein [Pandoraea sp. LA3]MDN4585223.1 hypothetical protein [Pandoraea capi]
MPHTFHTTQDDAAPASVSASPSLTATLSQRRLNDFLDVLGQRFGLSGLQSRDVPGAGVTLENGDMAYFRSNGTLDTFDLYFRIDIPPSMSGRADLIPSITRHCFSGDEPLALLSVQAPEGILLFGCREIEYGAMPDASARRLDACFSDYTTLIGFLRNEVH